MRLKLRKKNSALFKLDHSSRQWQQPHGINLRHTHRNNDNCQLLYVHSSLARSFLPSASILLRQTTFRYKQHGHHLAHLSVLYISRGYLDLTILALLLISIASALLKTYMPLPRPLLTRFVRIYHVHFAVTGTTISELGSHHLTILALLLISISSALLKTYMPLPRPLLTRFVRLYHVHFAVTGTTKSELGIIIISRFQRFFLSPLHVLFSTLIRLYHVRIIRSFLRSDKPGACFLLRCLERKKNGDGRGSEWPEEQFCERERGQEKFLIKDDLGRMIRQMSDMLLYNNCVYLTQFPSGIYS